MLDVPLLVAVAVAHQGLAVRLEVAVGVTRQPQVRRLADQHALVEHLQRARQDQPIDEHRLLVHPAVAIGVLEHADAAERRALVGRGEILHVAEHLDHPHAAVGVPVDRDRVLHHRLARDQLGVIARRQKERLRFGLGRARRRVIRHLLQPRRPRRRGCRTCLAGGRVRHRERDQTGNQTTTKQFHRGIDL